MQTFLSIVVLFAFMGGCLALVVRQIRSRPQDDFLSDENDWGAQ